MAVSRVRQTQGCDAITNGGDDLDFLCNKTMGVWCTGGSQTVVDGPVKGVAAYDSEMSLLEELEQIALAARSGNTNLTHSGDVTSINSVKTGRRSAADSIEASHVFVSDAQTPSPASMVMVSPLERHVRVSQTSREDYHTIPIPREPFQPIHNGFGGEVTHPTPLDRWAGTYERYEWIAYQSHQPPAVKRKTGAKRHR